MSADKAYDSEKARQQIKDEGALPVIPSRSNATKKAYCPKRFYRQRYKIQNFFCRVKDWRRIHALRQACPQLSCRYLDDWHALLDQAMSPDPNHHRPV